MKLFFKISSRIGLNVSSKSKPSSVFHATYGLPSFAMSKTRVQICVYALIFRVCPYVQPRHVQKPILTDCFGNKTANDAVFFSHSIQNRAAHVIWNGWKNPWKIWNCIGKVRRPQSNLLLFSSWSVIATTFFHNWISVAELLQAKRNSVDRTGRKDSIFELTSGVMEETKSIRDLQDILGPLPKIPDARER